MNQIDSWQGATILADTGDELIGKTLNNSYVVERILGEGGMGRVYLASHTRIAQKRVAIKVLHPEYVRNFEALARFQREAETAASISHPNVVVVYDVDRTPQGLPYLVCEYLEGFDLAQYLKEKGRLEIPTAVHLARQLCEGLVAAHRCGVIHRDLKPHNVFLVGDFSQGVPEFPFVKILDFGMSKFMDAPEGEGQLVTKTGVIMGTPAYMPPEQAMGQKADHRADVYGVGALLYTCLTGRTPFEETTPQATVLAVIGTEPPRPRSIQASIPEYAELVIQRAMSKQPAERYPDMAALLDALLPMLDDQRITGAGAVSQRRPGLLLTTDSDRLKTARPVLVFYVGLGMAVILGSAAVAVAGMELFAGWILTRREFGLILACTVAVAVTPTVLVIRWIQRQVWEKTSRVRELLSGVRAAVVAAVTTYGLAWFAAQLFDGVVLRLLGGSIRFNLSWPGWNFLLPIIAIGASVFALWRERAMSAAMRGWKRALVSTTAMLATLGLAALVIPLGFWMQTQQYRAAPTKHAGSVRGGQTNPSLGIVQREPTAETPANDQPAAPKTSTSVANLGAASAPANPDLASEADLRAATSRSVEGLLPLTERYPKDPRVLKALVLAHASRAAELGDAMAVARRLLKIAPEEGKSGDLQYLVQRAAETPGTPADLAWKMMVEEMGTYGPDVLYNLTLTKPRLAERAGRLLNDASVRPRITPALSVAHALRIAPSCAARLPLLERAADAGDERSITVLAGLSTGAAHGCGRDKRRPCLPACPDQTEQFRAVIGKIAARLKAAER